MIIVIKFKKPVKCGFKQYISDITQLTFLNNVLSIISDGKLKTFSLDVIRSIALSDSKGGEDGCEVPQSD